MPSQYAGFPFDFALGVLSLRSTLAQQDAHLQQIRAQQRISAELEAEKNRIQEEGQALQYAGHQQAIAAQGQRQAAELASNEKIAEMRLQEVAKDRQADREARAANITSKIGKEPVFVPSWMKLPAEIPVPEITDETGQKKPAYTIGRFADPNGQGEFIFPITNTEQQEKYNKLKAEIDNLGVRAALGQMRGQLVQAQTDRINALKAALKFFPATVIQNIQKEWLKFNDDNRKAIDARRALNAQDPEIQKMEADPFYRIRNNETMMEQMKTLQAIDQAIKLRAQEALGGTPDPHSIPGSPGEAAVKKEILESLPSSVTAPPEAFPRAANYIEEHGLVTKEGGFRPEIAPGHQEQGRYRTGGIQARKMLERVPEQFRDQVGLGRRITYYGERGEELGQEIYSEGGTLIRQVGTKTIGAPVQARPDMQIPAPSGVPAAPATTGVDRRRLNELSEKARGGGKLSDQEKAEYDRLLKAAGI